MRRSILTDKIARRGRHIRQEYVVDPMDLMQARDLMTADPATLPGTMTAGDALRYFADEARHRSYPVVDGEGRLLGLVSRRASPDWRVSDLPPGSSISSDDHPPQLQYLNAPPS